MTTTNNIWEIIYQDDKSIVKICWISIESKTNQ
jgi:hypothetical protein